MVCEQCNTKGITYKACLVISITKFLIVIGSLHAYLYLVAWAITWVSNYRCPILTSCNWIPMLFAHQ